MNTKKSLCLILIILLAFSEALFSQGFSKGDKEINLSLGYGTPWVFRDGYQTSLVPVGISFDFGASDQLGPGTLSLGAFFTATTYKDESENPYWEPEYGRKASFIGLALRSTYHYQFLDELDTYAFLHLGAGYEEWNAYGEPPFIYVLDLDPQVRFLLGVGVGAKYYFSDNVFALAEIGYATAFFKLGIGVKL
ncbi:MAG: outer membrane beta-barrel protein [Bacteroidales bacterium]|nr:outer membrane beta-barrel protein [Bacteroidales bacterium]